MKATALILLTLSILASCSTKRIKDLKSPCVSNKGGPCDRRPVNMWLA